MPTLTSDDFQLLGLLRGIGFGDGEMRHIGPRLFVSQRAPIEQVVQFTHAIGTTRHAQEGEATRRVARHLEMDCRWRRPLLPRRTWGSAGRGAGGHGIVSAGSRTIEKKKE